MSLLRKAMQQARQRTSNERLTKTMSKTEFDGIVQIEDNMREILTFMKKLQEQKKGLIIKYNLLSQQVNKDLYSRLPEFQKTANRRNNVLEGHMNPEKFNAETFKARIAQKLQKIKLKIEKIDKELHYNKESLIVLNGDRQAVFNLLARRGNMSSRG